MHKCTDKCALTLQKYRHEIASFGEFGVETPSNGPNRVPLGITPVLQTPSVCLCNSKEVHFSDIMFSSSPSFAYRGERHTHLFVGRGHHQRRFQREAARQRAVRSHRGAALARHIGHHVHGQLLEVLLAHVPDVVVAGEHRAAGRRRAGSVHVGLFGSGKRDGNDRLDGGIW